MNLFAFVFPAFLSVAAFGQVPSAVPEPVFELPKPSATAYLRWIYETRDADALMGAFRKSHAFALEHPRLFAAQFEHIRGRNDGVDLRAFPESARLSAEDGMRLSIRVMARTLIRLREIPGTCGRLREALELTGRLSGAEDWKIEDYFGREAHYGLASSCPETLLGLLRDRKLEHPAHVLLALLRTGRRVPRELILGTLRSSYYREALPLLYYLDDPEFKVGYLDERFEETAKRPYAERLWLWRDLVNVYASFPAGARRLRALQETGRLRLVQVSGIWFGTPADSGVDFREVEALKESLALSARYIAGTNEAFGGKEPVLYVDVTPDVVDGQTMNTAGWSEHALYATLGDLKGSSARATAFAMTHEACEQRFYKGRFSSELGRSYLDAFSDGGRLLEAFRLGRRIGGSYVDTGLGHPWDSEREWLAEVAGTAVIGEPPPEGGGPALAAVRRLFRSRVPGD